MAHHISSFYPFLAFPYGQSNGSPSHLPEDASYAPNGLHCINHILEEVLMFVYLFPRTLCSAYHVCLVLHSGNAHIPQMDCTYHAADVLYKGYRDLTN